MVSAPHANGIQAAPARSLPPVMQLAVLTLALVVIGGVWTAAFLPNPAPEKLPPMPATSVFVVYFRRSELLRESVS